MIIKNNDRVVELPLYEVKELSMEEALLVLAADKESLRSRMRGAAKLPMRHYGWSELENSGSAAA